MSQFPALFLVLVTNGVVGGTWGPLPYGMDECQTRRIEFMAIAAEHAEMKDWVMTCEYLDTRPALGEARP